MEEEKRPEKRERREKSELNAFENLYENFRNVPEVSGSIHLGLYRSPGACDRSRHYKPLTDDQRAGATAPALFKVLQR